MRRVFISIILIVLAAIVSGCVSTRPILMSQYPPAQTPRPSLVPDQPTPMPSATPSNDPLSGLDALGNTVSGPEHYKKYLAFRNMQVYEHNGDTFFDAVVESSDPEPIVCAMEIRFYEEGEQVALAKIHTGDGQYMLVFPPGETAVYARVDTDMTLIQLDYELSYDDTVNVIPMPGSFASPGM